MVIESLPIKYNLFLSSRICQLLWESLVFSLRKLIAFGLCFVHLCLVLFLIWLTWYEKKAALTLTVLPLCHIAAFS